MSYLESLLPPAAGDRAQAIALKHLPVASKVALAWCALSAITGFTLGNTDGYVSLGRFVACAFGLMSVAQLLRHADQVKVDRQTYWLLIRRGMRFGLGLSLLTIVAVITADGLSPSLSGFARGLASAWFITPASTCLIQGVMRYRYRQDEGDSEVQD